MSEERPTLRVGAFYDPRESYGCWENLPTQPCRRPGYEIEVFDSVMRLLGWRYRFHKSNTYGTLKADGNWTGLVRMAVDDEIDVTALTMRATTERRHAIDFSQPVGFYQQIFIFGKPQTKEFHQFIGKPFSPRVWLGILLAIILVTLVHAFALGVLKYAEQSWPHKLMRMQQSLWDMYSIILRQAYTRHRTHSTAQVAVVWIFACVVFFTYYQSIMYSLLAVSIRDRIPFTTVVQLTDLVESGERRLLYWEGGNEPRCPRFHCERMEAVLRERPVVVARLPQIYASMYNHTGVYFASEDIESVPHVVSVFSERLVLVRDRSSPRQVVAFGFNKRLDGRLRNAFNTALTQVLPGRTNFQNRYIRPYRKFDERAAVAAVKISMRHLQEFLWLWLATVYLALFALVGEYLWYWRETVLNSRLTKKRKRHLWTDRVAALATLSRAFLVVKKLMMRLILRRKPADISTNLLQNGHAIPLSAGFGDILTRWKTVSRNSSQQLLTNIRNVKTVARTQMRRRRSVSAHTADGWAEFQFSIERDDAP